MQLNTSPPAAYVEALNGLLQQAKRAARGFPTATHFIAIAYLRMSKLKHLPANPSVFVMSSSTLNGMEPLALRVSQPGYVLRWGEVVQSGTAAKISNNPNLSISYLGT